LLSTSDTKIGDPIFQIGRACFVRSRFALLGLIVYELMSAQQSARVRFQVFSWQQLGSCAEQSALPFMYGNIGSSLLALLIAVPLAVGVAVFTTEDVSPVLRRASLLFYGKLAGRHP